MIDLKREKLITIPKAIELMPTKPDRSTVFRWTKGGCRGVVLESTVVGSKRYTSKKAVERFLERLNAPNLPKRERARPLRARNSASETAAKELGRILGD